MIGDVIGYAIIDNQAKSGKGNSVPIKEFLGKPVRIMEFENYSPKEWSDMNTHNQGLSSIASRTDKKRPGVLVLNSAGTSLCMFDGEDVFSFFRCKLINNLVVAPSVHESDETTFLPFADDMLFYQSRIDRKGGYNDMVRHMVVMASLHREKFNDDFLFQKEKEEKARAEHASNNT